MQAIDRVSMYSEFFERNYLSKIAENIRQGKRRVTIEFDDLSKFNYELAEDLIIDPEESLKAAEIAIEQIDLDDENKSSIRVRVRGDIPNSKYRIRDLRGKHLNKFITIEGTIETKTDISLKTTSAKYKCPHCENIINVLQFGEALMEPQSCGCGRKGRFNLISKELMDCFTLRLQELSTNIKYGSAMAMKSVLCNGDLTDINIEERLIEGIKVKINGIYKEKFLMKGGSKSTQLITYIEANYIHISDESFVDLEITQKDVDEIHIFSKQPDLIKKIYDGLFQGIYGYEKIKEALVLQAFGGVSNYRSIPNIRGDIHILLIGDPGENKSVFLEYASNFNPKSILVVGKSVSAVGLSGATIKDDLSGSFVLKPGAIPLANNGLLCLDELDKMRLEDRDILHEPMEQQRISISKANLPDRKMLARESFLVSMNPKNSYFNSIDPIYNQIDLPSTLLSRFCLIFIMKKKRKKDDATRRDEKEKAKIMMTRDEAAKQKQLSEFHKFMRKYIGYSKQNIFPKFDKYLAEEYLPDKYAGFDHDKKSEEDETFPITPRYLNVIKRISEARARIFLRENILVEDVDYAIKEIEGSLVDIAIDTNTGRIDQEWVVDGVSSKRKKLIELFDEICDKVQKDNGDIQLDDFYNELAREGIEGKELEDFLFKKNQYGEILYPKGPRGGIMRRN